VAAALLCQSGLARAATAPFALKEIAAGVYVHSGRQLALEAAGHDDIANTGFIIGTRCVAVIDTGGSLRTGRALRAAVRRESPLPVCYVINTHVHVDHVLGNAAFTADHPQFIGHAALAAAIAGSREFFVQHYADDLDAPATGAQIIGPDRGVDPGTDLQLDLGGRRLSLRAWGKAHTDCDLTVYDATTRTLFSGDLLFVGRTPALDGSIGGWLQAIDALPAYRAAHLVPGHGEVQHDGQPALAAERGYLAGLREAVRAEIGAGKPLQEAIRDLAQQGRDDWLLWDETQPRNIARAYQELEWE
jgi:quinoprotein relay system zinc metallohydrolase 2